MFIMFWMKAVHVLLKCWYSFTAISAKATFKLSRQDRCHWQSKSCFWTTLKKWHAFSSLISSWHTYTRALAHLAPPALCTLGAHTARCVDLMPCHQILLSVGNVNFSYELEMRQNLTHKNSKTSNTYIYISELSETNNSKLRWPTKPSHWLRLSDRCCE